MRGIAIENGPMINTARMEKWANEAGRWLSCEGDSVFLGLVFFGVAMSLFFFLSGLCQDFESLDYQVPESFYRTNVDFLVGRMGIS